MPLRFDDVVTIALEVTAVGRTSATHAIDVTVDGRRVASATMVIVFTDAQGRPRPWPEEVARALRDDVPVAGTA